MSSNVQFDTADGTATRTDNDYTSVTGGILTIAAGNTTGTIEVNTGVDSIVELDESFTLTLSNIEAGGATVTFADNQGTGTITNDDTATLAIDDISASEADGTVTFNVTLTGDVEQGFTVDYATADDSASAGQDYTATAGTLSFTGTNGETQSVTVNLTNDAVVEDAEFFNVLLSDLSSTPTMRSPSQTTPGSPPLLMTTRRSRSPLLTPRSLREASCPSRSRSQRRLIVSSMSNSTPLTGRRPVRTTIIPPSPAAS